MTYATRSTAGCSSRSLALVGAQEVRRRCPHEVRHDLYTLDSWSALTTRRATAAASSAATNSAGSGRLEGRGGVVVPGARDRRRGRVSRPLPASAKSHGNYATARRTPAWGVSSGAGGDKGRCRLALSGTGNGVDLGFAFGRFTIMREATRGASRSSIGIAPRIRTCRFATRTFRRPTSRPGRRLLTRARRRARRLAWTIVNGRTPLSLRSAGRICWHRARFETR